MWDGHPTLDRRLIYDQDEIGIERLKDRVLEPIDSTVVCPFCGVEIPLLPEGEQAQLHRCFGTLVPGKVLRLRNDEWALILRATKEQVIYFNFSTIVVGSPDDLLEREVIE